MGGLRNCITIFIILILYGCGTGKNTSNQASEAGDIKMEDRAHLSLLAQIRRLPGVNVIGGVPVFVSTANSLEGTSEPLYVLDDYIVGSTFSSVSGLVSPADVKKIEAIKGADASVYGSRGGNGVIKISTKD